MAEPYRTRLCHVRAVRSPRDFKLHQGGFRSILSIDYIYKHIYSNVYLVEQSGEVSNID